LQANGRKAKGKKRKDEDLMKIDAKVDESLIESFPASDPPSFSKIRVGAPPMRKTPRKPLA
jgi:hypothetical protein